MAQDHILRHAFPAQVQVTIFETRVLIGQIVLTADEERQGLGTVQYLNGFGDHFHFAGLHFGVLHPGGASLNVACNLQHPLHADIGHRLERLFREIGVDRDLDNSVAIAQIEKDDPAMVTTAMHPSGKGYFLSCVGGSQFATGMCFVHCSPPNSFHHEGHEVAQRKSEGRVPVEALAPP